MYERFTDRSRKVMQLANEEAQRFNHEYIGTEHILLGLVKEGAGVGANVLKNLNVDLRKVRLEVEKIVLAGHEAGRKGKLPETPRAKKVIEYAIEEAHNLNHHYVGTEHLLLGLVREEEGVAAQVLLNLGVRLSHVRTEVLSLLGENIREEMPVTKQPRPVNTVALDAFGIDLTQEAKHGRLPPIVGRKEELDRIILVLGCMAQNNPILVGPPGAGKGAVIRGLANLSASVNWPITLKWRRLVALNLSHLMATSDDQEQATRRLRGLMAELRANEDVIVYLDDWQPFIVPSECLGREFICSAFRSALVQGHIHCVLVATPEQYQSRIGVDPILCWHFQPINIEPLAMALTLEVLRAVRPTYENHHHVEISEGALEAVVAISDQYIKDRCFPRKAVHLLDLACSLVRLRHSTQPPDLTELQTQIHQLNQEKEGAVAEQDFSKAASLLQRVEQLKKKQSEVEAKWNQDVFTKKGEVDRAAVEQAVVHMGMRSME
jgi:ATP-dependent Clp protease ATP-binding subunit ClpC